MGEKLQCSQYLFLIVAILRHTNYDYQNILNVYNVLTVVLFSHSLILKQGIDQTYRTQAVQRL